MKRLYAIILFLFTAQNFHCQDILGQWNGVLKVQGIQLRIIFNITGSRQWLQFNNGQPGSRSKGYCCKIRQYFRIQKIKI